MNIHEELKCKSCQRIFEIIYNHRDGIPECCPFCNDSTFKLEVMKEVNSTHANLSDLFPPGMK